MVEDVLLLRQMGTRSEKQLLMRSGTIFCGFGVACGVFVMAWSSGCLWRPAQRQQPASQLPVVFALTTFFLPRKMFLHKFRVFSKTNISSTLHAPRPHNFIFKYPNLILC
jgi:hypothetical protein